MRIVDISERTEEAAARVKAARQLLSYVEADMVAVYDVLPGVLTLLDNAIGWLEGNE